MKEDWKECKLGEVLTIKYGKNQKEVESPNGTIPIYGTGGLMGYATKFLYDKPSILIGRKGTINKVKFIDKPFWTVDTLFYSIINEEIVSPKFLYYQLSLINFMNYNEGTTIPSLRTETLNRIEVSLPPLATQQKIATILSSLDNKIELNNKINDNLEQQAQAIFKSWFVDFEPFGGKMPEGWRVGKLSEIADIIMGQSPDGKSYNEDGIGTVFYQGRAEFGTRFPTRRLFTTEPKRIAKKFDTLMSVRAPVGDLNIANEDCCIGRGLAAIHSKDNHQSFVHYTVVTLRPQLDVFNGEGTVFGCINRDALNNMEVIIPSKIDLDKFEKIVTTMDIDIFNRSEENDRLKNIRDTLLPKLMNGDLKIWKY